ncbi:unnamed protein product [Orchesella dallaii]|uniref:Uncharacterized protein n=1 Tax=Orchesella dallaii TaxID=48710 RepID=A0ABP1RC13_9HEXA
MYSVSSILSWLCEDDVVTLPATIYMNDSTHYKMLCSRHPCQSVGYTIHHIHEIVNTRNRKHLCFYSYNFSCTCSQHTNVPKPMSFTLYTSLICVFFWLSRTSRRTNSQVPENKETISYIISNEKWYLKIIKNDEKLKKSLKLEEAISKINGNREKNVYLKPTRILYEYEVWGWSQLAIYLL